MNKYSSTQRREIIARIVADNEVRSQEELLKLLRREGVRVAQPTLSRDIAELGIAKTPAGYALAASVTGGSVDASLSPAGMREERLAQALRDYAVEIRRAGTIVVVKTTIATAQPLARAIDDAQYEEVVGTLGGDDTIFLATEDIASADRVIRRLNAHLRRTRTTRHPRA